MNRSHRLLHVLVAVAAASSIAMPLLAQTPPESQRISFQIATGPVSGSYLRVGEVIARIISNPPGLTRCEDEGVCGPEGLIATSRSSSGSVANAMSVNNGRVNSAIVQGDVALAAFEGTGPFKAAGALKNLRAIARLHDETLHLVVGARSRIKRLADLSGKRVGIDARTSATNLTVRAVLLAANVSTKRLRLSFQSAEQAADDLKGGRIDAYFAIGALPIRSVDSLIRRGQARVVAIDARTLAALEKQNAMFSKFEVPADTYRGLKPTMTLNVATVWLVSKALPENIVYGISRSLWNPANRIELSPLGMIAKSINVATAAENLPVPLHAGAQRFYAEAGR